SLCTTPHSAGRPFGVQIALLSHEILDSKEKANVAQH
ncbi:MAG: hypothetical protein ACI9W2_001380, partial [Gammaproteobacteria bacterium]